MSAPAIYRIVIQGRLAPLWSSRFAGLELSHAGGTTLLHGPVKDQAELFGHLMLLRDLGLEIVSVSRGGDHGQR